MIDVYFTCGHRVRLGDRIDASPRCVECGCAAVARVIPTRLPRFVGTVMGPLAEYKGLAPTVVNVAPGGPLTLTSAKES